MEAKTLFVGNIMSSPVVTVREHELVKGIAVKMRRHNIGSVVVVDNDSKPIGIVTQGDIVRKLAVARNKPISLAKVVDVMSWPVITIESEKKLEDAANLMVSKKIKKLCVVDKKKNLVGIVTDNDVMKNASYLIDVLSEMVNAGYVKEAGIE